MKKKYIALHILAFDIEPRTCILQYSVQNYRNVDPETIGDTEEE